MLNLQSKLSFLHFFFIFLIVFGKLPAQLDLQKQEKNTCQNKSLEPYLLPRRHPLHDALKMIFKDPKMFKSSDHFKQAGFKVIHGHRKLMVGSHYYVQGYLFKKFPNSMTQEKQLENFIKRLQGAEILRQYVLKYGFNHLVVPKKWLYRLPKSFSQGNKDRSYLLIVENMDIYNDYKNPSGMCMQMYYHMNIDVLTELCTVLHAVGGCDAFPRNQPFTKSGKIAFVDTEHVGKMKGHFLKHIVPALNPNMQAYAVALWNKLEQEEQEISHFQRVSP
ncbi:hypothetical protein [Candidatus Protochlamydia amoebophila]|uniref:Uncharacterized protein n=1 Tax=Candidatus Protochlamydia amoebophila TaxID=362787 RepID=A0A0C1JX65_9BACT|nr:hypothetical protein [Candidatus Protochlamydia amoebophila]KIC71847.1 hypothetical protein DB44_CW00200 [Candidatus Protochlamydia amoebophila]